MRNYFNKYNISFSDWWVSPNPTKEEILFSRRDGKPENEREISRISVIIDENDSNKFSFGLSGYNHRSGKYARNACSEQGYNYKIHVKIPKKSEDHPEKKEPILGRWWLTKNFNNLEDIVKELKQLEPFLLQDNYDN